MATAHQYRSSFHCQTSKHCGLWLVKNHKVWKTKQKQVKNTLKSLIPTFLPLPASSLTFLCTGCSCLWTTARSSGAFNQSGKLTSSGSLCGEDKTSNNSNKHGMGITMKILICLLQHNLPYRGNFLQLQTFMNLQKHHSNEIFTSFNFVISVSLWLHSLATTQVQWWLLEYSVHRGSDYRRLPSCSGQYVHCRDAKHIW